MTAQYRNQYHHRAQQSPHVRRGQESPYLLVSDKLRAAPTALAPEAQRLERERQEREQAKRKREDAEADRRRATRPTDKTMPEGVDKLIVGDGVAQYKKLREVERKLDSTIMRKRLDMQDSVAAGMCGLPKMQMMRIWISNTVENQPWQGGGMEESAFDFNMENEASYKVKIEGRLMEDGDSENEEHSYDEEGEEIPRRDIGHTTEAEATEDASKPAQPPLPLRKKTRLSHFFKSITIDFDRNKNLQPEGMTQVEWKKPALQPNAPTLPPGADFDSLEFERKSDENINCTINFYRDETPERFLLAKPLSDLLDTTEDDRTSILMGIWEYIKAMGLQQDEEKRQIQCDEKLKAVSDDHGPPIRLLVSDRHQVCDNRDTVYFPHIPAMLTSHLSPLPPISVPYTIRVDPDYHSLPTSQRYTIYSLLIPVSATPPQLPATDVNALREISRYDQHLANLIQAIGGSQRKHSFLSQMGRDPVNFTKRWMASQKRDLEVLLGEDGMFEDENKLEGAWSRGGKDGVWGRGEVKEAVGVMVQRPDKAGRAF
ncbi:MAG: hypothetical protein Q9217_002173 [Psora testacea]